MSSSADRLTAYRLAAEQALEAGIAVLATHSEAAEAAHAAAIEARGRALRGIPAAEQKRINRELLTARGLMPQGVDHA